MLGLHAVTYGLCDLVGKSMANQLPVKNRRKLYEKMDRGLQLREQKVADETLKWVDGCWDVLNDDDVFMILEDVCKGHSILSPHNAPNGPTLVRRDYTRPPSADNVILMNRPYADKHIRRCHDLKEKPGAVWEREVKAVYERRAQEILKDKQWFMGMSGFLPCPAIGKISNIRLVVFSFYI